LGDSVPKQLRVAVETGPKGKKAAAFALDWPGLERGGKTGEAALEALQSYLPRYAPVAKLAGLSGEFATLGKPTVVEQFEGPGSTDFWGISFGFSSLDTVSMSTKDLERGLSLMQASWAYFDDVRGQVSAGMRKGPRGGGRDRDRIVGHVLGVEQDWARKVGVRTPDGDVVTDAKRLKVYRDDFCEAIRMFHAQGKPARNWPLRYLIRHAAYHAMDHAWEMEDKDLTGQGTV
jgi:hypothetical protein